MATPSLFPIFLKAQAGGGATSVSVIVDGVEFMEPIEAVIVQTVVEADILDVALEVEIPEPIDLEID